MASLVGITTMVALGCSFVVSRWATSDANRSGEVDFEEFFAWWTNPGTQQYVGKSRERMEKLKQVFDTLDEDARGELSRAEIVMLAGSLGAKLTPAEIDQAVAEMDSDNSDSDTRGSFAENCRRHRHGPTTVLGHVGSVDVYVYGTQSQQQPARPGLGMD